jgi:hypothetical protein
MPNVEDIEFYIQSILNTHQGVTTRIAYNHYMDFLRTMKKRGTSRIDGRLRRSSLDKLDPLLHAYARFVQCLKENCDVTFNEVRKMRIGDIIVPTPSGCRGAYRFTEPERVGLLTKWNPDAEWVQDWQAMMAYEDHHRHMWEEEPLEERNQRYVFSEIKNHHKPLPLNHWKLILDYGQITLRVYEPPEAATTSLPSASILNPGTSEAGKLDTSPVSTSLSIDGTGSGVDLE